MRLIPFLWRCVLAVAVVAIAAVSVKAQCGQWQLIHSENPHYRTQFGMVYDSAHAQTVMFGGEFSDSNTCAWDGTVWTPLTVPAPPGYSANARYGHAMAYDSARGRTVLFGGYNFPSPYGDTWECDGAAWTQITTIGPPPRLGHAMAYDSARGRIVLFGGVSATTVLSDTWEWDGTTWTQVAISGPSARVLHAMAFDSVRGRVVLFGGANSSVYTATRFADTWEWDGTAWTQVASTGPSARSDHSLVFDAARRRVVLFGGYGSLGDTWEWDGSAWSLGATSGPPGRYDHAMAYDSARSRVVLYGGAVTYENRPNDTWEWDGTTWTQRGPTEPASRQFFSMVYDMPRHRTVLFGGGASDGNPVFGDTWAWDGASWARLSTAGPAPRTQTAMAYDPVRDRIVLFGGQSGPNPVNALGDTWEWDGTNWSALATTGPSARFGHAMIFDPNRGTVLLFGGSPDNNTQLGDTWEWDGTQWRQIAVPGPTPRRGASIAFDALRQRVMVFGGVGPYPYLQDTWLWNGSSWTQASPRINEPDSWGRPSSCLAFDSVRNRVILFSGGSNGSVYPDLWEWDGIVWTRRSYPTTITRVCSSMVYDSFRARLVLFGGNDGSTSAALGSMWELPSDPAPPLIQRNPAAVTSHLGGMAMLSVDVDGTGLFSYQWYRQFWNPIVDGHGVPGGGDFAGSQTPVLTISNIQVIDGVNGPNRDEYRCRISNACSSIYTNLAGILILPPCGSADFNHDGSTTDQDIEDFFACLAGNCCPSCDSADFNADGDSGTDADIEAFFRVLGGGTC